MRKHNIKDIESRCEGLEIRHMNAREFANYYGPAVVMHSTKGYVFLLDGEYVGAAGVEMRPDSFYVFSEMKEDAKLSKQTIWRCANLVSDMIDKIPATKVATSDVGNKSAHKFCEKFGYEEYARDDVLVYFYKKGDS